MHSHDLTSAITQTLLRLAIARGCWCTCLRAIFATEYEPTPLVHASISAVTWFYLVSVCVLQSTCMPSVLTCFDATADIARRDHLASIGEDGVVSGSSFDLEPGSATGTSVPPSPLAQPVTQQHALPAATAQQQGQSPPWHAWLCISNLLCACWLARQGSAAPP